MARSISPPLVLFLGSLWLLVGVAGLSAQEEKPAPLTVEGLEIAPQQPGAETLCRLAVRVRNAGDRPVSQLAFTVTLDGAALPVYEKQLFYQLLPPGETTTVQLFNFWTSESDRPPPADGKLDVEVALTGGQWMKVERTTDDEGELETWTPEGEVPGLPSRASVELQLVP